MKNISLLLTAFFFTSANGQITQKTWLMGGNLGFSYHENKSLAGSYIKFYEINLNPNIGYFFVDKLVAGPKLSYFRSLRRQNTTAGNPRYDDFNIGPFIRYYLLPADQQFNIITEATYQYGFTVEDGRMRTAKNTFTFTAGPVIYLNTSVGLEFLITYSTYKNSGFEGYNNTVRFGLGLQFYLEKEE